jgi:serine protease Do
MMRSTVILLILLTSGIFAQTAEVPLQKEISRARDRVLPALVHVEPVIKIYTRGEEQHTVVTGSGVIFSPEGYVLTNHHVAANAAKVWCTLSNKERITATVVGSDPSTDIAVLKLNIEELNDKNVPHAKLGNSDSLEVGEIVLALGSPLGLSRSVSMGVVSSIDRYFSSQGSMVSPYNLWIQTDAAINPGNSGGPLINLIGEVIGINARAVFFAENLGFAIPINLVKEVAEEIIQGNSVKRSWVGLEIQQIKDLREYLELPDLRGALVAHVEHNSPAAKAGINPGDVIQKIGDYEVDAVYEEDLPTIRKIISSLPIDEKIAFQYWRNREVKTVFLKIMEEPLKDEPEVEAEKWGMVIKDLSWYIYRVQSMEDFNGVYITSVKPGSPAEYSEIRNGDVVRKINGEIVQDSEDFKKIYDQFQKQNGEPVFLELIRSGHPYYAVIKQKPTL